MWTQLVAPLSAIAGAALGATATYLGQRLAAKTQRDQAARARAESLGAQRRHAVLVFLVRVDLLLDSVREMARLLGDAKLRAGADAYHPSYVDSWRTVIAARGELRLEIADQPLAAAGNLLNAVYDACHATDEWYRNGRRPGGDAWQEAYDRANAMREEFIAAAQKLLATDVVETVRT